MFHALRLSKLFLCLLACLTLFAAPAAASKNDWTDKAYDFHKINTAVVYDIDLSQAKPDSDIVSRNLQELFQKKAERMHLVQLTPEQASRKISLKLYKDLDALQKTAPDEAAALFNDNLKSVADIYIKASLDEYSVGGYVVPAHTEWRDRQESYTWTDRDGHSHTDTRTISYPEYVPEHYVSTVTVKVRFDAYDAATGKAIFSREESRTRDSEDNPHDVYERIISSFFGDINDKAH